MSDLAILQTCDRQKIVLELEVQGFKFTTIIKRLPHINKLLSLATCMISMFKYFSYP